MTKFTALRLEKELIEDINKIAKSSNLSMSSIMRSCLKICLKNDKLVTKAIQNANKEELFTRGDEYPYGYHGKRMKDAVNSP